MVCCRMFLVLLLPVGEGLKLQFGELLGSMTAHDDLETLPVLCSEVWWSGWQDTS